MCIQLLRLDVFYIRCKLFYNFKILFSGNGSHGRVILAEPASTNLLKASERTLLLCGVTAVIASQSVDRQESRPPDRTPPRTRHCTLTTRRGCDKRKEDIRGHERLIHCQRCAYFESSRPEVDFFWCKRPQINIRRGSTLFRHTATSNRMIGPALDLSHSGWKLVASLTLHHARVVWTRSPHRSAVELRHGSVAFLLPFIHVGF